MRKRHSGGNRIIIRDISYIFLVIVPLPSHTWLLKIYIIIIFIRNSQRAGASRLGISTLKCCFLRLETLLYRLSTRGPVVQKPVNANLGYWIKM